ncbi:hypothetical protein JZ751_028429 [Albula glossodonta]|uniref:Uncharacterized protein n=1 Tax=Albula glossodonta TaxID=121402 RepID=A0A8T2MNH0_9TELE|nr:hypothetical protein JZ751_028429 [Albula glossodonta]
MESTIVVESQQGTGGPSRFVCIGCLFEPPCYHSTTPALTLDYGGDAPFKAESGWGLDGVWLPWRKGPACGPQQLSRLKQEEAEDDLCHRVIGIKL